MIAVARVVMNRVQNRRYPGSPCEVIYEGPIRESWKTKKNPDLKKEDRIYNPVRHKCQFSWYCDGKVDEVINKKDNIKWKIAEDIAFQVLAYDKWNGMVEGATHYHATYVSPKWRHTLRLVGKIDDHIFYRQE
jgi:spore germination cell wall hydrolase CwlJ-like protein